jgi:hypothetical protein
MTPRRQDVLLAALGACALASLGALIGVGPLATAGVIVGGPALVLLVAACLLGIAAGLVRQPVVSRAGLVLARGTAVGALVAILADPGHNGPDMLLDAVTGLVPAFPVPASAGAILVGALVLLVAFRGSGSGSDERRTRVRQGSSIGPVTAVLLRLLGRGFIGLLALAVRGLILLLAWVVDGLSGVRAALAGEGRAGTALAGVGSCGSATGNTFSRLTAGWGRTTERDVWHRPASLARDGDGQLVAERIFEPRSPDAALAELAELVNATLIACDVALPQVLTRPRGGQPENESRGQPVKLPAYRMEIARAWSTSDYHAVIVRAQPTLVATALARLTTEQLIPGLDAHTGWTSDTLRGLRLSDPRIAQDPLRGGERGLFVALDRVAPDVVPSVGFGGAVDRALREAGLAGRFRHRATDERGGSEVAAYSAPYRTAAEWRDLEQLWKSLQPAVALYARDPSVKLEGRIADAAFIATRTLPATDFPTGEATHLRTILARFGATLRAERASFVVGLDAAGEPLYATLGDETPHLLVAGGTGSGKSVLVRSALAQLLVSNTPAQLRVTLLDSVKRELVAAFSGAPHVAVQVVADDGDQVVAALQAFAASMDDTYRRAAGRPLGVGAPLHLLIVEEWADLHGLLSRSQSEEVGRLVARIGQVGRGGRHHLILCTQKASAAIVDPRIKASLRGRIAGHLPDSSDYGILFDRHRQLVPNITGRFAVSLDGGEPRLVQGVYADAAALRDIVGTAAVAEPSARWRPTQGEIDVLAPLTAARVVLDWQEAERVEIKVSVRGLIDRLRALGYSPGRSEKYTLVLAELEERGVLRRIGTGSTAPRSLALTDLGEIQAAVT